MREQAHAYIRSPQEGQFDLVSTRAALCAPIYQAFAQSQTGEAALAAVSHAWERYDESPMGERLENAVLFTGDLLGNSLDYLEENPAVRRWFPQFTEDPSLKLPVLDQLRGSVEVVLRRAAGSLDQANGGEANGEMRTFFVANRHGLVYLADSLYAKKAGKAALSLLRSQAHVRAGSLNAVIFDSSKQPSEGVYYPSRGIALVGTGSFSLEEDVPFDEQLDIATVTIHEETHGQNPPLLSLVNEARSYAREFGLHVSLEQQLPQGVSRLESRRTLQEIHAENYNFAQDEMTRALDRFAHPNQSLTANHNTASEIVATNRHAWRIAHGREIGQRRLGHLSRSARI